VSDRQWIGWPATIGLLLFTAVLVWFQRGFAGLARATTTLGALSACAAAVWLLTGVLALKWSRGRFDGTALWKGAASAAVAAALYLVTEHSQRAMVTRTSIGVGVGAIVARLINPPRRRGD